VGAGEISLSCTWYYVSSFLVNINYCCWTEGSVYNGDLAVIHAKSANVGQSRVSPIATLVCMHVTSFCLFLCFRCWFLLKIFFLGDSREKILWRCSFFTGPIAGDLEDVTLEHLEGHVVADPDLMSNGKSRPSLIQVDCR
jgi:hypothetical protein